MSDLSSVDAPVDAPLKTSDMVRTFQIRRWGWADLLGYERREAVMDDDGMGFTVITTWTAVDGTVLHQEERRRSFAGRPGGVMREWTQRGVVEDMLFSKPTWDGRVTALWPNSDAEMQQVVRRFAAGSLQGLASSADWPVTVNPPDYEAIAHEQGWSPHPHDGLWRHPDHPARDMSTTFWDPRKVCDFIAGYPLDD